VAVLAMKSKEIAFTLPVAAALFEAAFFEGSWRRRRLHLAPLLVTLAVIPLALLGRGTPLGEVLSDVAEVTRVQSAESRCGYLVTRVPVVATYLRLLAFPAGQNVDHDFPRYGSLAEPRGAASLLLLGSLAAGAAWLYRASGTAPLRRKVDPAARLVSFGSPGSSWRFSSSRASSRSSTSSSSTVRTSRRRVSSPPRPPRWPSSQAASLRRGPHRSRWRPASSSRSPWQP
jgi:hypothetical protein